MKFKKVWGERLHGTLHLFNAVSAHITRSLLGKLLLDSGSINKLDNLFRININNLKEEVLLE